MTSTEAKSVCVLVITALVARQEHGWCHGIERIGSWVQAPGLWVQAPGLGREGLTPAREAGALQSQAHGWIRGRVPAPGFFT